MKTNKAMRNLLNELAQSNESIPTFREWDNCIIVDASSLKETDSIEETHYQDRTDLEASINHYHIKDLRTGIKLISNWKEKLKLNYPEKEFILILSSTIEFRQLRWQSSIQMSTFHLRYLINYVGY